MHFYDYFSTLLYTQYMVFKIRFSGKAFNSKVHCRPQVKPSQNKKGQKISRRLYYRNIKLSQKQLMIRSTVPHMNQTESQITRLKFHEESSENLLTICIIVLKYTLKFSQLTSSSDNKKCQSGFRPLCNKILLILWKVDYFLEKNKLLER